MTSPFSHDHTVRIESVQGWEPLRLEDVWAYRELLFFLIWRDLKVAYARTMLGVGWAVLKPVLSMVVFTGIFGWLTQLPSEGVPYPIFVFAGLLPWQLLARVVSGAGSSLVANESLVTKVYFPRLLAPLAVTVTAALDFAIGCIVLFGMMWHYDIVPTALWFLPCLLAVTLATGLGVGLWIAALNAFCKDIGHVHPFFIQMWMFATPIVYPVTLVPEAWRLVFALNPMMGVVEGFRGVLFRGGAFSHEFVALGVLTAGVSLVSGLYVFKYAEQTVADRV